MAVGRKNSARRTPDFLFVGGNPALDFVNTRPVLHGQATELLSDFPALLRWFVAAHLLDSELAGKFHKRWTDTPEARATLRQLLAFREQLRREILAVESGKAVSRKTLLRLNRLLAQHPLPVQIVLSKGNLRKENRFEPRRPADFFAPLLEAAADLFTHFDPRRLRRCQSCVLHFHDATKNGTRRWCSMKLCGNRAKVAKYAAGRRQKSAETA